MSTSLLPNQFLLYADDGYDSHVVRFLLEEKKLSHTLKFLPHDRPDELAELNPYRTLPILVGKEVVLYETNIIFEYLEERYGMGKLLPADPKDKAQTRLLAWRLQKDWLSLGRTLLTHPDSFDSHSASLAKKTLTDLLITLSPLFARTSFFYER